MTRDELMKLADRVEALTGPDRVVDAEIACAIRFPKLRPASPDDFDGRHGYTPGNIKVDTGFLMAYSYTRSLDDAMTLVPEGWVYRMRNDNGYDEVTLNNHVIQRTAWSSGSSLARALTAAALRSHASSLGE